MSTPLTPAEIGAAIKILKNRFDIRASPKSLVWRDLGAAISANSKIIAIGVGAGLLLAIPPGLLNRYITSFSPLAEFALSICEHVGIGLIVAAIAVVAYEWGSDVRQTLIHSWALVELLSQAAEDRLESAHTMLFGSDAQRFESLRTFAENIDKLRQNGDWAKEPYLDFFADSAKTLADNALSISTLSTALHHNQSATPKVPLRLSKPGDLTDKLLTGILRRLRVDSKYCAVSNALIWKDLTQFREAHQSAIENGVTIQRIFVLFQSADNLIPDSEAISTVYEHFKLSKDWKGISGGGYEIKTVNEEKYREKAKNLAKTKHFGVFRPGPGAGGAVAFDVLEDDLSAFEVLGGSASHFIHEFDGLWASLPRTEDKTLRYLLRAERMRRMNSGSYSAISSFDNWNDEGLNKLHDGSMAAAARRVVIRRIFFFSDRDQKDSASKERMKRILTKHAAARRSNSGYKWLVCNESDLPAELTHNTLPVPYGLFEDRSKGSIDQAFCEIYSGNEDQPFEVSGSDARGMVGEFDKFWSAQEPRLKDTLKGLFGLYAANELMR